MTDDRLKSWLGFWKWLISSVVVTGGISLTTIIIDAKNRSTELQIQINQEEKEYLTRFLDRAMDDNLEKRLRFAQYFAHVSTTNEYKEGWKAYYSLLNDEYKKWDDEKQDLVDRLPDIKGKEALERAKSRITFLQRELISSRAEPKMPLRTEPLYEIENISKYQPKCPDGSRTAIWGERVHVRGMVEFPSAGLYITKGCYDPDRRDVAISRAWYPNGKVVEELDSEGKLLVYYPDGQKAIEGIKTGKHSVHVIRTWNPDGSENL